MTSIDFGEGGAAPLSTNVLVGKLPAPLDPVLTFRLLRVGPYDPTCRLEADGFHKAFWSPDGPCTLSFHRDRIEVVGPGADWCLQNMAPSLQFYELPFATRPRHELIWEKSRALTGLRFTRVPWLADLTAGLILQQRVTYMEACQSYRKLVLRYGIDAPCRQLKMPLNREQWLKTSTAILASYGVDGKRATTLLRTADLAKKFDRLYTWELPAARELLSKIPGIGPWTREHILGLGLGDTDAVPTGDVHLPRIVAQRLGNLQWGDDDMMLDLLKPYSGQRFQVIRLLLAG